MSDYNKRFKARIDALGPKSFNHTELLSRTSTKNKFGTPNSKPLERLWDNIIPTIIILDALREEQGKPISLQSIYRSEACNQASSDRAKGYTGRAKTSRHMAFTAIDFIASGMPCTTVEKRLRAWMDGWGKTFVAPVLFERKAEKVAAGNIPFGELPRSWPVWPVGTWFSSKG